MIFTAFASIVPALMPDSKMSLAMAPASTFLFATAW